MAVAIEAPILRLKTFLSLRLNYALKKVDMKNDIYTSPLIRQLTQTNSN